MSSNQSGQEYVMLHLLFSSPHRVLVIDEVKEAQASFPERTASGLPQLSSALPVQR